MSAATIEGRRIRLRGTVQGVGMRPWIYRVALEHHVTGRVCNESSGVTIDAFGEALDRFVEALGHDIPPAAVIERIESSPLAGEIPADFTIVESRAAGGRRVSIPPDLATCEECAREILDPGNRRYRYPFTNCTNCGPRFTIATGVPYDRPATTMAPFVMCAACQREYDEPRNRRFHAQPNACPVCGPRLTLLDSAGREIVTTDAVRYVAERIGRGDIVAVKGIGGFHLACDAGSPMAVATLRARKRRDEKPFAVMAGSLAAAEELGEIGPVERRLLTSIERPIVLLSRRAGAPGICDGVAPGNPLLGVMLPYTPLHHLLLRDCGAPLVMTSANLSEEPIVYRNGEAVERLGGIADLLVVHDREIVTRCDDSVVRVIGGAPVLLRRSRGYVPRAISLHTPVAVPVLATGALLKNTFCLAAGDRAWLGPHIGDLENEATARAFEEAVERLEQFVGVRGEVVAHDLHPDYLSTRYALGRAASRHVGVQHHHAHVASLMAERGIDEPVLGLSFDGTGYGLDGTSWGGEFLLATLGDFTRVGTFRALALPGGDAAIRQPWRTALAALDDAFEGLPPLERLGLFGAVLPNDVAVARRMVASGVNSPRARGVGRYFDVFGALVLGRRFSRYEGQVAFDLNMVADPAVRNAYPFSLDESSDPPEIDLRPALRACVDDLLHHLPAAPIAARVHNTVVAATTAMVTHLRRQIGGLPVALTGGCFQNAWLVEGLQEALGAGTVIVHERVPAGDGGIALGQALVAASRGI